MNDFIPLSVPNITGNEKKYVNEALDQEWVSSGGPHITKFENTFKEYLHVKYSSACQSGTAGLHLCLVAMGIVQDDIVLVPTLTFIATINSVMYQKASPVFFDCDEALGINTNVLEKYLTNDCEVRDGKTVEIESGKTVKAIIPVHVFGNTSNMSAIMKLAEKFNLLVIEDATESLGGYYKEGEFANRFTGAIGHAGVFSFNGNKIITTGGGGMVVSNDKKLIDKISYLSTQAKDDTVYFVHNQVGYNYRLTNIQAALGLGQMEQLNSFIKTKEKNYNLYCDLLKECTIGKMLKFHEYLSPNYWFYSFVLKKPNAEIRDKLIKYFTDNNVQTRPIWKLNHTQEPFKNYKMNGGEIAAKFYDSIINIPCSTNLGEEDVRRVCKLIIQFEEKYFYGF